MRGRPPLRPDPGLATRIEILRSAGYTHKEISIAVDLDPATLRRLYADSLTHGAARAEGMLIAAMFRAATAGSTRALRFWLASRGIGLPTPQRRKA